MNPDDPWAPKRKSSRLEKAVSVAESQSVPKKESDPSLKNAYAELLRVADQALASAAVGQHFSCDIRAFKDLVGDLPSDFYHVDCWHKLEGVVSAVTSGQAHTVSVRMTTKPNWLKWPEGSVIVVPMKVNGGFVFHNRITLTNPMMNQTNSITAKHVTSTEPKPILKQKRAREGLDDPDPQLANDPTNAWNTLMSQQPPQFKVAPPWPIIIGKHYRVTVQDRNLGTTRDLSVLAVSPTQLRTDQGLTLTWPPPEHIRISFPQNGDDDGESDPEDDNDGEEMDDDDDRPRSGWTQINDDLCDEVYTLPQILAFSAKHGPYALKQRLLETYAIYSRNFRGMKMVDDLVAWTRESRGTVTRFGERLLVELQTCSASLQGKDAKAARARLTKEYAGSNAFLKLMATGQAATARGGQRQNGFRQGFRQNFRNSNNNNQQQRIPPQCSWCGKPYHTSLQCFARNPRPGQQPQPQTPNIIPMPGFRLC